MGNVKKALCVQERPVREVDSSVGRLDDFLLFQAKTNFDEYHSKWIVGATFDALPASDYLQQDLVTLNSSGFLTGLPPLIRSRLLQHLRSLNDTGPKPTVIGHFTVESYHAIAISLALIDLAKLRYLVPAGYHIETINHPLPRQPETVVMDKVALSRVVVDVITIIIDIIVSSSSAIIKNCDL